MFRAPGSRTTILSCGAAVACGGLVGVAHAGVGDAVDTLVGTRAAAKKMVKVDAARVSRAERRGRHR